MRNLGLPDSFWAKVDRSGGPGACWIWKRALSVGYGSFRSGGRTRSAHRTVLEAKLGRPLRAGHETCHDCPGGDNRACVNPDHLWEGTRRENIVDSVAKGRRQARGEGAGNARLKTADIIAIRAASGTTRAIAKRFGVNASYVWHLRRGDYWKHVPMEASS